MGIIATGLKAVQDALNDWESQITELNRKLKVAANSVGLEFANAREVFGMLEVYLMGEFKEKGTTWKENEGSQLKDHWDKRCETLAKKLDEAQKSMNKDIAEIRGAVKTHSAKMYEQLKDAERVATNLKKRTKLKKGLSFLSSDKRKKQLDGYLEAIETILDKIPKLRKNVDALSEIDVTCTTRLQSCVDSLVIEKNWKLTQLHKKTTDYSKGELEKYLEKIEEGTVGASNFRELSLDKEYKAIKEFLDESDDLEEILDT